MYTQSCDQIQENHFLVPYVCNHKILEVPFVELFNLPSIFIFSPKVDL